MPAWLRIPPPPPMPPAAKTVLLSTWVGLSVKLPMGPTSAGLATPLAIPPPPMLCGIAVHLAVRQTTVPWAFRRAPPAGSSPLVSVTPRAVRFPSGLSTSKKRKGLVLLRVIVVLTPFTVMQWR